MTHTHSFTTTICDPTTSEPLEVEVFYAIRDCGVIPGRRAIRAVITSIADESHPYTGPGALHGGPAELLPQVDSDTLSQLEAEAMGHYVDDRETDRYGTETV